MIRPTCQIRTEVSDTPLPTCQEQWLGGLPRGLGNASRSWLLRANSRNDFRIPSHHPRISTQCLTRPILLPVILHPISSSLPRWPSIAVLISARSPLSTTSQLVCFIVPSSRRPAAPFSYHTPADSCLLFSALGEAIATQERSLVYGGGSQGIMGIISSTVLHHGGSVTAVIPTAMIRGGGEGEPHNSKGHIELKDHEKVKIG